MHILWTYLRPHSRLAALALIDPIIFGTIIDAYALNRAGKTDDKRYPDS